MQGWNARLAAFVIACSGAVAACSEPDLTAEAVDVVEAYLAQVSQPTADRGWSLLLPSTRETEFNNDLSGYIERASLTDWSTFVWSVGDVERDEPYAYVVEIVVTGELPELVDAVTDSDITDEGPVTRFSVRYLPYIDGPGGIHQFE